MTGEEFLQCVDQFLRAGGGEFVALDFDFEALAKVAARVVAEDRNEDRFALQTGVAVLERDKHFAHWRGHAEAGRHLVFAVMG